MLRLPWPARDPSPTVACAFDILQMDSNFLSRHSSQSPTSTRSLRNLTQMSQRKRSRGESEDDNRLGMGATLSRLNGDSASEPANGQPSKDRNAESNGQSSGGEWQQVESKGAKRRKKTSQKESGGYPSITHS